MGISSFSGSGVESAWDVSDVWDVSDTAEDAAVSSDADDVSLAEAVSVSEEVWETDEADAEADAVEESFAAPLPQAARDSASAAVSRIASSFFIIIVNLQYLYMLYAYNIACQTKHDAL